MEQAPPGFPPPGFPPPGYWVPPRPPRRNRVKPALIAIGCFGLVALWLLGFWAYIGGFSPSSGRAISTKVAVSRSPSGQLTIYVLTCPRESIEQVTLYLEDSQGDNYLATLWEIRSSARTTTSLFAVGASAPGFHVIAHSTMPVKPDDRLSVNVAVNDSRNGFVTDFHARDALRGSLYVDGDSYLGSWLHWSGVHASLAKFRSVRNLVCENQNDPPGG
jgi:hypothetical protein